MATKKRKYTSSNMLVPYYKITWGGKPLSSFENTLVEEVIYEDNSSGSDLVSITFHDPDYHIIGDKRLVTSTTCKVIGGYKNRHWEWINGYVSAVDVDFPEEGYPMVTVHVMDKSYILNKLERRKVYKKMTYYGIASMVAKRHGLSFEGDNTGDAKKKQDSVSQSYETDIQFLTGIAEEIGFLVYVRGNKLYFKDRDKLMKRTSSGDLWYKKEPFDIINFRPRIIQADQPDEIEEKDIEDKGKKKVTAKFKNTSTTPKTSTKSTVKQSSGSSASKGGSTASKPKTTSGGKMKYNPRTGKWTRV